MTLLGVLSDRPEPRADFVFVNRAEISTLDPVQMSWLQDFRVAGLIFEGLTRYDTFSPGFNVVPGAAERWEVSSDGLTYTFHLRADAKWSNGEPVRPGDFVFAWRRVILPDGGGDYAKLFECIRGVREFRQWRSDKLRRFAADPSAGGSRDAAAALWQDTLDAFAREVGIQAPDERTLVVHLARPTPYFLDLTAFGALYPVHPPLLRAHESIDARTGLQRTNADWTKPDRLVVNGPFVLDRWRFKRDMHFARNPHYWDRASLNLDTIACLSIPDGNAQVLAFRTSAVDWTSDVMPSYRGEIFAAKQAFLSEHAPEVLRLESRGLDAVSIDRSLPADPRATVHAFPAFGTYFYNFNCRERLADGTPNPFADSRVRRAFTRTIDRAAICRNILRGGEKPAATFIPPGSIGGYRSPAGLLPDADTARAELVDAGFPNGRGFPEVQLLVNSEGDHSLIAQGVARDWERILGVRVRVVQKETRAFREDVKNGRFMVSRASWFGDYGDPTTFLDTNHTGDGNNDRGFSSREYDQLLDRAAAEPDAARRMETLARAEQLLVEEQAPFAPVYQYVQQYLFDPHRVSGITTHPRQSQDLARVDILGDGKGAETPAAMKR